MINAQIYNRLSLEFNNVFSIEDKYTFMVHTINEVIKETVPLKSIGPGKKAPYPPLIKKEISLKKQLWNKKKQNSSQFALAYKLQHLRVKKIIN